MPATSFLMLASIGPFDLTIRSLVGSLLDPNGLLLPKQTGTEQLRSTAKHLALALVRVAL
jgi:hypothetical protein